MKIISLSNPIWLAIYVVLIVGELSLLVDARIWSLREFSTADSQDDWNQWKAETVRQAEAKGPVSRRESTSTEPPTLVLLRDYFWMLAVTLVALSTVLYVAFAVALKGAFLTKTTALLPRDQQDHAVPR